MAKVVITIEDQGHGTVKVISDPNFETLMKIHLSGTPLTAAHGYAMNALNAIRAAARKHSEGGSGLMRVGIPRLIR